MNPLIQAVSNPVRTLPANLPDSGGFEGMALNASRTKLYALLEKAVNGDPVRERLLINEFSLKDAQVHGQDVCLSAGERQQRHRRLHRADRHAVPDHRA